MPRGEPNKNTIRVERYHQKTGLISKSYKLKKDLAGRFADACEKQGVSQASQITKMMEQFIQEVENEKG